MNITLRDAKHCEIDPLKRLYESVEWKAYTRKPDAFMKMVRNSFDCIGAFDGKALVGLIRVLSDGAHILYIQDLLVMPKYQRKGIGRGLLEHVLTKYKHIRQKVLITDADSPSAHALYRACGLKAASDLKITCYVSMT